MTNDAATDSVAEMVDQKVGWIREGAGRASTTSSCRSGTSSPRSPTTVRRWLSGRGPGFRARPRSGARSRDHLHRHDRRDLRPARRAPRAVGRELRRDRRRPLRSVRPGRGTPGRNVTPRRLSTDARSRTAVAQTGGAGRDRRAGGLRVLPQRPRQPGRGVVRRASDRSRCSVSPTSAAPRARGPARTSCSSRSVRCWSSSARW